ncbi:hypothetical protein QYF61_015019, partial [Mycteria americana]
MQWVELMAQIMELGQLSASEFGTKRRTSTESNEPCEKKTKARQVTLEDICNPLKTQDKKEPQKCEKPRICLQTLDRLREFCSDSDQQCNRVREDSFREKESLSLEKCPSIIGRSSELKNPLQSGDTSPKVAQKEELRCDLSQFSASLKSYENTQNTSDTNLNKRTKSIYTPLELQFIEMKKQYKDAVLCVECGYKYRFFGEDAELDDSVDVEDVTTDVPDNYLLCISENGENLKDRKKGDIVIGIMAIQPTTGEVIFDSFRDCASRLELESRVLRLQPVEIILPSCLSDQSEKLINSITSMRAALNPFIPQPVLILGVAPMQVQDPALGLVEPHEVHMGPLLQLVQVPLDGMPSLRRVSHTTQPGVICKLAEGALDPTVCVIDEDIKWFRDDRIRIERMEKLHFEYSHAFQLVTDFYAKEVPDTTGEVFQPSHCFHGPPLDPLQKLHVLLALRAPDLDTVLQVCM